MAKRKKKLVPDDGGAAYKAGFGATDCPFGEGTIDFIKWNDEWDAAADEATEGDEEAPEPAEEEPEEEPTEKSVVKAEYRARYAEMGHPTTCGDELANLLNNLCLTKAGIDLPRFEHIMEANGVDLSKYNRTTNGWQGRLRMTGRNVLAGKVFANGGVVKTVVERGEGDMAFRLPLEGAEAEYKLSSDWMASRRKVKADA